MNEQEIIEKAKTDELILDNLLTTYKPLVISIARKYYLIGGELDDLVQEGMIGLYRAVLTYTANKQTMFKTFATLCVTRQIQSAVKKANREKNKPFLDLYSNNSEIFEMILSSDPNPEDLAVQKESAKEITKLINLKLSKLERQILKEYFNGKSYQEIAIKLNINKKSVDNGLNRIIKKLEKIRTK